MLYAGHSRDGHTLMSRLCCAALPSVSGSFSTASANPCDINATWPASTCDIGNKLRPPRFIVQQVYEHGAGNPIVARLALQTFDLVQWLDADKKRRENIFAAYLELHRRLLSCFEFQVRLVAARDKTLKDAEEKICRGEYTVPFVISLQAEVEGFLLASKQYLRELARTVNLLFDAGLDTEAKVFWAQNGEISDVARWAMDRFGPDHHFSKMLISESEWVSELVKKRNAVEHPGGRSGALITENFQANEAGFTPPSWQRSGDNCINEKSDIYCDLDVLMSNLLTFAEDLLVSAIQLNPVIPMVIFAEIPVQQRDPNSPVRIRPVLDLPR